MFEQNIENETKRIKSLISFDDNFIELDKILAHPDIPDFVKIYFSSDVIWWIYQEDLRRNSLSNFNLEKKEYRKLNQEFNIYYYNNSIFNKDDFDILLRNAINLKINYLLRPFNTLLWFIFKTDLQKPLSEISLKMNYFSIDDYFLNFIRNQLFENISKTDKLYIPLFKLNYFDFYPDKNFSKFEFINILSKTKNALADNISLESLLKPFFDLKSVFNPDSDADNFDIPIEAIIINFNDCNFKNLTEFFENLCINQNITSLKLYEFRKFIENFLRQQYTPPTSQISEDKITSENPFEYHGFIDASIESNSFNSLSEKDNIRKMFELLVQPDRVELIRIANQIKNELDTMIPSNTYQDERYSDVYHAANELSKYLSNELNKSEFDKYIIRPQDLRKCNIDEIIIISNNIEESTLEFEFGTYKKE